VVAGLIDWTGTGFYLAISAIFLTRAVGMTGGEVGITLAIVGLVAFTGSVPVARLGDRFGARAVLIWLHVARAAAFAALVLADPIPLVLAALSVIGLADQAAASLTQALAGDLVPAEERVPLMARLRTVTNVGITLGTVPAGLVLTGTGSFAVLLAANAVSYLGAAAIIATLPRARPHRTQRRRRPLLRPATPTTALIAIDGVMSMWNVILNVGLPLWVLQATAASPAIVAILYGTNTVLAVLLQTRVSRRIVSYARAARAQQLAGALLAAACVGLAAAATGGSEASAAILLLAVACLTLGELLKAAASWQITFALAPPDRSAEFFATYGLGRVASQVCGPVLITAVVLALGAPGWLLLAIVFVIAAAATPPLARLARARPTSPPRPPRDPRAGRCAPLVDRLPARRGSVLTAELGL